jgi:hypothetical protein
MSWIHIEDLLRAVDLALEDETLEGPVNAVSPEPVTNREFTKCLGTVLRRPTLLPVPAFAANLLFGEMAEEMLLAGQRVNPRKLMQHGFDFRYPRLEQALRQELG